MKTNLIIVLLFLATINLYGQNYYVIDFVGLGGSIESISIDNISQGTNIEMNGGDILHLLFNPVSVIDMEIATSKLSIFPNPMKQMCNIEFFNGKEGLVNIILYSITGEQIYAYSCVLPKANHNFVLSGVVSGSYIIAIQTETDFFTERFISLNSSGSSINLNYSKELTDNFVEPALRKVNNNYRSRTIVEMQYNIGDELRFTGFSEGVEDVVIYDSPNSDMTYSFVFSDIFECGNPILDARDSKIYQTVRIGNQCWLAENLKFLPEDLDFDPASEGSTTDPYYYVYDFEDGGSFAELEASDFYENYNTYGILYNWSAAMGWDGQGDPPGEAYQGICPEGWHLPSHDDWTTLEKNVGSDPDAFPYGGATVGFLGTDEGDAIKDPNFDWCNNNPCGTSGFNARPGGRRYTGGIFYGIGTGARWWTSTEFGAGAWRRYLEDVQSGINRFTDYKTFGFSVRCVKD
jgi:uncharacterized protein (TIGR02145 family)